MKKDTRNYGKNHARFLQGFAAGGMATAPPIGSVGGGMAAPDAMGTARRARAWVCRKSASPESQLVFQARNSIT